MKLHTQKNWHIRFYKVQELKKTLGEKFSSNIKKKSVSYNTTIIILSGKMKERLE